jgi:ABC-type multidrug transport system ATPase subunit
MEEAVSIRGISKSYKAQKALDNISLSVGKGELFGFIGPDGAGKTSLFRILTTLLFPDEGEASLEGLDIRKDYKKIRQMVGYMPGRFSLYPDLTVEENLRFFASIFNTTIEENYELVKDIYSQIEPFKDRPAGKLSGGMKQKLALSCALIHKPHVLFLDEPTTGVDAVSRKEFWLMLKRLQKQGISILVSTPYMDEASLCDRVALIQEGKILDVDSPEGIISKYEWPLLAVRSDDMYHLLYDLREFPHTVSAYRFGENIHLSLESKDVKEEELARFLENKGQKNVKTDFIEANVEDCFMALMNK